MHKHTIAALTLASLFGSSCAKRVPEPSTAERALPHVSWVIMSGDRENADREFVCQSDPRNECIVPASRPEAVVFSDVHFYYHGAGAETKYRGSIQIGFFDEPHGFTVDVIVRKNESITNQSVNDIVSAKPGTYEVSYELDATATDTGKTQPIRGQIPIVVR